MLGNTCPSPYATVFPAFNILPSPLSHHIWLKHVEIQIRFGLKSNSSIANHVLNNKEALQPDHAYMYREGTPNHYGTK